MPSSWPPCYSTSIPSVQWYLLPRQFSMEMVALFAATALLLAALGIYGTISYLVHEQSREIAVRLALGTQRSNILRMDLRHGLTLAADAGVGLVGALVVSHLMASLLYGVSPYSATIEYELDEMTEALRTS
jgi:ABC-type antimicrobial peptide transport system permease subunit